MDFWETVFISDLHPAVFFNKSVEFISYQKHRRSSLVPRVNIFDIFGRLNKNVEIKKKKILTFDKPDNVFYNDFFEKLKNLNHLSYF